MSTLLIKNTFLHFDENVEMRRPRTESCDAIVMGRSYQSAEPAPYHFPVLIEEEETTDVGTSVCSRLERRSVDGQLHLQNVELCGEISLARATPIEQLSQGEEQKTTVMLRNIPNKYSQQMLLDVIDARGFHGLYDFFYLPIDFRNRCNVGYAFINFTHPHYALIFKQAFQNYKLSAFKSQKVCEVSWGRVQGMAANVEHYRNSAIMSVAFAEYKPKIFKHGLQVAFPVADGPLPNIKLRPSKVAA